MSTSIATSRRRGFSLIETIAALVVLTVAIPPMLWAVREAQIQRINPMLASKARWLAAGKLEDIVADRHSESGDRGWDYLDESNYPDESKGDIVDNPQFSRTVALTETGVDLQTAGTGYMNVTVTVGWDDGYGNARALAVSTVLTEYDPS